jgi:CDP-diacylglycerol--serine O-phosphatidyltransferase
MIGVYDYTVIMTYVGLLCALFGMTLALDGSVFPTLLCMGGCLFCDMVDGPIARAKKNRTRQEALYGVQIDSLCDVISFGVFPGVFCYSLGMNDWLGMAIIGFYCLCCVIRLGYFNVLGTLSEEKKQSVYHGLPVPTLAIFLPLVVMLRIWLPAEVFVWVLRVLVFGMSWLYILDFRLKKPGVAVLGAMCLVFWIPVAVVGLIG